jgi:hypothetical protein
MHLVLLAGLALHRMLIWYWLVDTAASTEQYQISIRCRWQPRLPEGFPFVISNGLWPSALILVGNAALVVGERVYVYAPPQICC